MVRSARLLLAYDEQLRTDAEASDAVEVTRHGPLHLIVLAGGRGFVTYRDLQGATADTVRRLVSEAVAHFAANPAITTVEWKTRGHDVAPGLHEALLVNGFVPADPESIMIGEARLLVSAVPTPEGVHLRRVTDEADVRAMAAMHAEVFGRSVEDDGDSLVRRLTLQDGIELWIAEARGQVVSCGRMEPVAGSQFAGLWGGATRPEWRGLGLYRALTAERARAALRKDKTLMYSESTEYSRPILERQGFITVSTTTPYHWSRSVG